ncbi:amidohydrolase [Sphingomonas sp. LHG3406-1]|uniref:amidohydrolase n=1 Tax=Sphingomonas sp. LHG3406-1 TaxID=2804617 RepID=UPI0026163E1C|nr:amidohydrolase family protein [Sphingomonas sp. LHG3406-1]
MQKLLLGAVALLFAAEPALADLLVTNVKGVRATPDRQIERFTGLLVGDDGKVKRVLKGEQFKLPAGTRVLNGGGRVLMPGLIDAHGHVMGYGLALGQLDLTGTKSLAELQQRLREYAAANPDLPWITGRGWNQELWPDRKFPTSSDLDAAVKDRPVWLERVDGHASVGNGAALAAAGVTAATKAPPGGEIIDGMFVDAATALVDRHVPAPTAKMRDAALARAQQALFSRGLTAVADMGTSRPEWDAMNLAYGTGGLKIRIMSYAAGSDALQAIEADRSPGWRWEDRLRLTGVKLYSDGALGSRGAWLKAPYADAPHTRGLPLISPEELVKQGRAAAGRGHQLAVHAIGDAANDMVLGAFAAIGCSQGDRRCRVEHAQIVDGADLNRFADGKVIASMQPVHQTSDRTMAEARLGPQRLGGAYAWQTLARHRTMLALGSDFPVEDPNPFHGLAAAVSRQGLDDQPPGGWRPWEKLTLGQALAGFTRDAAHAGFAEARFGGLDVGQWADFILVDRDPAAVTPHDLARTQVLETWMAGRKVWERAAGAGERG